MISGDGWHASFRHEHTDLTGKKRWMLTDEEVVYFDDAGGWVAKDDGPLRMAEGLAGFTGYQRKARVVAMCPTSGWDARYAGPDGHPDWLNTVVAWAVFDDGTVRGVGVNSEGAALDGDWDATFTDSNAAGYEPHGGWTVTPSEP